MKKILRLFAGQKLSLFLAVLFCSGSIIVTIIWNRLTAVVINLSQAQVVFENTLIVKIMALLILSAIFQGGSVYFSNYAGQYAAHDLRMQLIKKQISHSYREMQEVNIGEQLAYQQNEVEEMTSYMTGSLFGLLTDLINFICTFTFLLGQNTVLTLICNAPLIAQMLYVAFSSKIIHQYVHVEQENQKKMSGTMSVLLSVFPIIRIFEAENLLSKRYDQLVHDWNHSLIKEERIKARLLSVSGLMSCIPLLLLILIGGKLVMEGKFTIGMLYVFVNLSGYVSGVMMNMPGHIAAFRRFYSNSERVMNQLIY